MLSRKMHHKKATVVEANIEERFVAYAKKCGYQSLKFEVKSRRNHPDQQVFLGWGYSFFIEFKREGEKLRPAQASRVRKWRAKGYSVYVCDNLSCAMEALDSEVADLKDVMDML